MTLSFTLLIHPSNHPSLCIYVNFSFPIHTHTYMYTEIPLYINLKLQEYSEPLTSSLPFVLLCGGKEVTWGKSSQASLWILELLGAQEENYSPLGYHPSFQLRT